MNSTYQQYESSGTLAPATATPVEIDINCATNWTLVLRNTGANPITALTIAVSPLGTYYEAENSITTGIPLAAATSLAAILGTNEPVRKARLTITSTLGTTYAIEGGGL